MPRRQLRVTGAAEAPLRAALRALRTTLDVPDAFPAEALAEAERAAAAPRLPDHDATDIPLFTIDPPTSVDLDQAMHLSRRESGGYRVRYAIADVAAYVTPGGAVDTEAHRRVTTLYFPDEKVPLHPTALSEGAASLLPGQSRPAVLWTIDLDEDGRAEHTDVRRALVRSRAKLDYAGVQRAIDDGTAEEPVALLRDIGTLRERLEAERGGISLNVPEQEIVERDGTYEPAYRAPLPADGWNAQISLLTGMAAADLMITSGTGILRTLPTAPDGAVGACAVPPRRCASTGRTTSRTRNSYAPSTPGSRTTPPSSRSARRCCAARATRRSAAASSPNTPCTPRSPPPTPTAPPPCAASSTATPPSCASAACAGAGVPQWVLAALDELPKEMAEGTRRGNMVERECVDIVEAALLKDRVGELFDAVVVDVKDHEPAVGTVQLTDPAIVARVEGGPAALPLGERLRVRLTQADPTAAKVRFAPA